MGLFVVIALGLSVPAIASANTTFNVDTTNDTNAVNPAVSCQDSSGHCSLRSTIEYLNTTAPAGGATISLPAGIYTLTAAGGSGQGTSGSLVLMDGTPVSIVPAGSGSPTIDADYLDRALEIDSGTVTISGVTIENGRAGTDLHGVTATSCPGAQSNLGPGGAILDQGTLTLTNDTFNNNMAEGNGGAVEDSGSGLSISGSTFTDNNACQTPGSSVTAFGNGGAVDESSGASVTIDSSSVSGNSAQGGGGGLAESADGAGSLTVTGSTISGNQADGDGGGIIGEGNIGSVSLFADLLTGNTAQNDGGGMGGNDRMTVVNSTIYQNTATNGAGGAIDNGASSVTISFSTVNANSAPNNSGGNLANIDSASFAYDDSIITGGTGSGGTPDNCTGITGGSQGYNIFDDTSDAGAQCGADGSTDIVTSAPGLGPLADNGGPTKTEALQSLSPAVDAADPAPTVCSSETQDASANPVDQRGFPRPDGSETQCDIGAFELQDVSVSTTVFDAGTNAAWSGSEATGASAYDTASLSGTVSGFPASGSVTYSFFGNDSCSGSPASTDSESLRADGSVPNSSASSALAPGSYSYQAGYAGDSNYTAATGPCEPFSVAKATPSVATTVFDAGSNSVWSGGQTGARTYDTASLDGTASGFTPTGAVTYSFFTNASCSGSPASTDSESLRADGSVPNSSASSALAPGSYSYQAGYAGDSNYTAATGPCEPFSVAKATPSVATTVFDAGSHSAWSGGHAGARTYDTASLGRTISGFTPTGSVTYSFFENGNCSGNPASTEVANLNPDGTVPNSSASGALAVGSYSYQAAYSGDPAYAVATGPCEPFTIGPNPDLALTASAGMDTITVGDHDTVNDTITNVGGSDATDVQFTDPQAAFEMVSVRSSRGRCTFDRTTVSCKLGRIHPGGAVRVRIVVLGLTPGTFALHSAATMREADPTPANNRQSVSIDVRATPPPPPPGHAKGPPFINLARLGPVCRTPHSKIRLAATAHAGAGIRTVTIRLAHHTIYVYRSHPVAPRRKTVVTWVQGSALDTGRSYPVGATVTDVLGRTAHATASFNVCKPPSRRGFTG